MKNDMNKEVKTGTIIGVPKEIKNHEYRVGLTPSSVREVVRYGHTVIVETKAGDGIGFSDAEYEAAGAIIAADASTVFKKAKLIIKVKEPQLSECHMLTKEHTLFTYLHLAPDPEQAQALMDSGCTAIAYETVTDARGGLPLLAPMSEVAGRMSIQAGAHFLEKSQGGSGILLTGVPGVSPGHVVIIGGGVVGTGAARVAVGMGARVTIIDRSLQRLQELDQIFQGRVQTAVSTLDVIESAVTQADVVIGAVLVVGAAAPKLVTAEMLKKMRKGSVMVDVAIDQGGCFETSRPTTHDNPVYVVDDVIHYCVTNMPGGVARTSAVALNNATLPFVLAIAKKGALQAMKDDAHLRHGLNVHAGQIAHEAVAHALGVPCLSI